MMPTPNHRSPRYRNLHRHALLATAALLAACADEEDRSTSLVNLYRVTREDLPINVKEGGELVAVNETVVRSEVEGNATILALIPEGTRVKKGDKLVELDVAELVDKRASQEIAVEKARNELEQARTAMEILEKQLQATLNTAESQRLIAAMELEKLLGARDGKGSEGKNSDMVRRLEELVNPVAPQPVAAAGAAADAASATATGATTETPAAQRNDLVQQVRPQNYAGLIDKVQGLLTVRGVDGQPIDEDPLARDMGEMANKILQQVDTIRLAMADLKVREDTVVHSRGLAQKQFITRNQLERDELDYQSQASKVTIAWNDLELLINYTLERDKIELRQNLENAELEVARVRASNDAERKNSQFDVDAKQKEFEVATERLNNLEKQINNSVIYSPGDGLVVYSSVSRGRGDSEAIEEGTVVRERQSIIILPDNSKLECKIQVQEAMIDKVKVGMPALISAEVRPNETLTGRVTYVAPVADSQSRWSGNDKKVYTTKVLLDGINEDESLKAGMKAAATIAVSTVKDVLTVPLQCVRRDRAVNYVWKQTADGPVAVKVSVGANNSEKVVVIEGVDEGDQLYRTPPGDKSDPKFPQPTVPDAPELVPGSGDSVPTTARGDREQRTQTPAGEAGGRQDRGGRSGSRKKFTEMNDAELAERKSQLLGSPERMSRILDDTQRAAYEKSIGEVVEAIDTKDLERAQTLYDAAMAPIRARMSAMRRSGSDGGRGPGGTGGGGRRGGE